MKKRKLLHVVIYSTGILLSVLTIGCRQTQVNQAASDDDSSFRAFLTKWEDDYNHFINGDPILVKENISHSDDVTIFGAFGGYEKGWKEVGPRWDWASSQFKKSGAKLKVQYINIKVSGDIAYAVGIEQSEARLGDMEKAAPRTLRTTQIFQKENGAWKLLHRHADEFTEKKAPMASQTK